MFAYTFLPKLAFPSDDTLFVPIVVRQVIYLQTETDKISLRVFFQATFEKRYDILGTALSWDDVRIGNNKEAIVTELRYQATQPRSPLSKVEVIEKHVVFGRLEKLDHGWIGTVVITEPDLALSH